MDTIKIRTVNNRNCKVLGGGLPAFNEHLERFPTVEAAANALFERAYDIIHNEASESVDVGRSFDDLQKAIRTYYAGGSLPEDMPQWQCDVIAAHNDAWKAEDDPDKSDLVVEDAACDVIDHAIEAEVERVRREILENQSWDEDGVHYYIEDAEEFCVAKIKCYAAGDAAKCGVWFMDDRGDFDRGLSAEPAYMTLSAARAKVDDLNDERFVCMNGEFGRPDYFVLHMDDAKWILSDDMDKYDWYDYEGGEDDADAQTLYAYEQDERYAKAHAVEAE